MKKAFVKIKNGKVIQKQPNEADGFIECSDSVVCGMLKDGDSFVEPPPAPPTESPSNPIADLQAEVAELRALIEKGKK